MIYLHVHKVWKYVRLKSLARGFLSCFKKKHERIQQIKRGQRAQRLHSSAHKQQQRKRLVNPWLNHHNKAFQIGRGRRVMRWRMSLLGTSFTANTPARLKNSATTSLTTMTGQDFPSNTPFGDTAKRCLPIGRNHHDVLHLCPLITIQCILTILFSLRSSTNV